MRVRQDKCETHHLTCMVCGALPGTTCIDDDYHELAQVHPSRRMSIGERNWRSLQGWEPPELVEQRRKRRAEEAARAALFNPRHGPDAKPVRKALRRTSRAASLPSRAERGWLPRLTGCQHAAKAPLGTAHHLMKGLNGTSCRSGRFSFFCGDRITGEDDGPANQVNVV